MVDKASVASNGGSHLQFPNMLILTFHACACAHMSTGTPMPQNQSVPPPEPQGAQITKSQSPELIKIIWFCVKFLYLWTLLNSYRLILITPDTLHPPPRDEEAHTVKICCQQIEIIEFCLKICDPCAPLHISTRLDMQMGVPFQMALPR